MEFLVFRQTGIITHPKFISILNQWSFVWEYKSKD